MWETLDHIFKGLPVREKKHTGRNVGWCQLWSDIV